MFQLYRDGEPILDPAPDKPWAERDKAAMIDRDRDLKLGKHRYSIRTIRTREGDSAE